MEELTNELSEYESDAIHYEAEFYNLAEPDSSVFVKTLLSHCQQVEAMVPGRVKIRCGRRMLNLILTLHELGELPCNMAYRKIKKNNE